MKRFLRKWLGLDVTAKATAMTHMQLVNAVHRLEALESYFNSRDVCKICGKHRYNSPDCLKPVQEKFRAA